MSTAATAAAIVHFVGLCVFTQQSSIATQAARPHAARFDRPASSSHIVVILPRVASPSPSPNPNPSITAKTGTAFRPPGAEDVETHTAVIVFRACDYLGSKGWNPIDLQRADDEGSALLYVELDKDIVTIQANGNNPPISLAGSGLPSISAEVPANAPKDLLPGYRWPYDAAAAVFDIAGGTLKTCRSRTQVKNVDGTVIDAPKRVDTEITLNNDGVLIFSAPGKSLKLKGNNTKVAIGNVPLHYAKTLVGGYVPHYRVYCAMVGTTNPALCQAPSAGAIDPCYDDYMLPPPHDDGGSSATRQTARMTTPGTTPTPTPPNTPTFVGSWPPIIFRLVGPECSNTQYP
jgi:hypothetical protein